MLNFDQRIQRQCLRRTVWAVWIALLLLNISLLVIYLRKSYLNHISTLKAFTTNTGIWMTCVDKCVSKEQESVEQSIKAAEGRGMTCFWWRCDLYWPLLPQLREWWMYDRYECSSSLSNGNTGKCSVMSVMVTCVS